MSFSITFEEPVVSISSLDCYLLLSGMSGDFKGWDENGNRHFLDLPKMSVYHDGEMHVYTQIDDIEWIVDFMCIEDNHLVLRSERYIPECITASAVKRRTVLRIPITEDGVCLHS